MTRVAVLGDRDPGVRWASAIALGKMGGEAVPSLVRALEDQHAIVRAGAALALGKIGPNAKGAVPSLMNLLKDKSPAVREKAAGALGEIGPGASQAVDPLVQRLSDEDPFVNGMAAEALGKIGLDAVPALIRALESDNAPTRWCATIALGKMGPDALPAAPALTRTVKDGDALVRWGSTVALGNIGKQARTAIPALLQALSDGDEDVRWGASVALDKIDSLAVEVHTDVPSLVGVIDTLTAQLMKSLRVPGVSIALIRNRSLVWSKSYGVVNARTREPVTTETLFEACSMTKPVFAYTVMKLVEQGKLDLDRPLAEYIEESCLRDQPYHTRITARMVLSHTSGLPNWRKDEEERDGPLPVKFIPGSKFGYSGEGMYFLQRAVEKISGEPLDVYAKHTLFDPAGLTHMSYVWTEELDARIAAGHDTAGAFLRKTSYTHPNAAYTLYTSADEYAKFLVEIMKTNRSGAHSLSQHSIDTMLSRQVNLDTREPVERPGKARGTGVYWGLGWSLNATAEGDIMHHSGSNRSGFRCFSQFNTRKGSGIVIMTNSASGGDLWTRLMSRIGNL
jgi:CubicO group peptidase (beta-lactamase class C family)